MNWKKQPVSASWAVLIFTYADVESSEPYHLNDYIAYEKSGAKRY